jgi:7,8-dihydroneopterin aldolase/epimerase/oxygenase
MNNDLILISNLELSAHIGITAQEREKPQRLTISLVLCPKSDFSALDDRIENTVDYQQVCAGTVSLASREPRNLIETLAEQIARMLLADFPLKSVEIELRKYILPETEFVAVKIRRDVA